MSSIVSIGTLRLDEYYQADRWPDIGAKTVLRYLGTQDGGSVANAACVFAALGAQSRYYDVLPDTQESSLLLARLAEAGVDVSSALKLSMDGFENSKCIITVCCNERTVLEINNPKPTVALAPEARILFEHADYIYTDFDALSFIDSFAGLFANKHRPGAKLALDIEYAADTQPKIELMNQANALFFNEFGFRANKGRFSERTYANQLLHANAEFVVITRGEKGSTIYAPSAVFNAPAMETDVLDTTGAGDTFNATFLLAHLHGNPLEECIGLATAAATLCISKMGARDCIRDMTMVQDKLKKARNNRWHVIQNTYKQA